MAPCFVGWFLARIFPFLKEISGKEWYGQVPMLGIAFLVYLSMCDGLYSTDKEIFLLMLREVFPFLFSLRRTSSFVGLAIFHEVVEK